MPPATNILVDNSRERRKQDKHDNKSRYKYLYHLLKKQSLQSVFMKLVCPLLTQARESNMIEYLFLRTILGKQQQWLHLTILAK